MKKYIILCINLILLSSCSENLSEKEIELIRTLKNLNDNSVNTDKNALSTVFRQQLISTLNNKKSLEYSFDSLKSNGIFINTSTDGKVRTYSWALNTGGSMVISEDIIQLKTDNGIKLIVDSFKEDYSQMGSIYSKVFDIQANNRTFYFLVSNITASNRNRSQCLSLYQVKDDKLVESNLIQYEGMSSSICINYDLNQIEEIETDKLGPNNPYLDLIKYNKQTNHIYFNYFNKNGIKTPKIIYLKFNGEYFKPE